MAGLAAMRRTTPLLLGGAILAAMVGSSGPSTGSAPAARVAPAAPAARVAPARPAASAESGPAIGSAAAAPDSRAMPPPCRVYPADNIWNTRIDTLPVHPRSAAWLQTMEAATTNLHPDFGRFPYGIPFAVVDNSHPLVFVDFYYGDESDPDPTRSDRTSRSSRGPTGTP